MDKRIEFWNFPEPLKESVKDAIEKVEWIIPSWIHRVVLNFSSKDNDCYCEIQVDYPYRSGTMTIYECWFVEKDPAALRHELIHLLFGPVEVFAKRLEGKDKELWVDALESTIVDWEYVLERKEETNANRETNANQRVDA